MIDSENTDKAKRGHILLEFIIITALYLMSVTFRFLPLLHSSLPFNIDGFPQVKLAENIIHSHEIEIGYGSNLIYYNSKFPVLPSMLAFFSMVSGYSPLEISQTLMPFIVSFVPVVMYIFLRHMFKNMTASMIGALFLVFQGFFVYLTTALIKESIGFLFIIIIYACYTQRNRDRKYFALSWIMLLTLPLIHHLTFWIGITTLIYVTLIDWFRDFKYRKLRTANVIGDVIMLFTSLLSGVVYYSMFQLDMYRKLASLNEVFLFLSVFVLLLIPGIYTSVYRSKSRFFLTLFIPAEAMILIFLNSSGVLFPSTVELPMEFLLLLIPFIIISFMSVYGWLIHLSFRNENAMLTALFIGPAAVYNFAISLGLSKYTFDIVYRSADFLDFAIAVGVTVFIGYYLKKDRNSMRKFTVLIATVIIVSLSYMPTMYLDRIGGVKDITSEGEMNSMEWVDRYSGNFSIATDDRYFSIMEPYFGCDCNSYTVIDILLQKGTYDMIFMNKYWLTDGAEYISSQKQVMDNETYTFINTEYNKIYASTDGVEIYFGGG